MAKTNEIKGGATTQSAVINSATQTTSTVSTGGGLTEGQQNALEIVGIDPKILPSKLTTEQEQCFCSKVWPGKGR